MTRWQIALVALWIAAPIAGAWSSSGYIPACEYDPQTKQESCPRYNMVLGALWHIGKFVDDWQASFIVLGTLAVAGFTWALVTVAARQSRLTETLERAVVKLSHVAGLYFRPHPGVKIQIANGGRAPAKIIDAFVRAVPVLAGTSLPDHPDYGPPRTRQRPMFLVAGMTACFTEPLDISPNDIERARKGEVDLYVIGYVDYFTLGKTYRNGYARLYAPGRHIPGGNNLVFMPDERGTYNFDELRSGSGNQTT